MRGAWRRRIARRPGRPAARRRRGDRRQQRRGCQRPGPGGGPVGPGLPRARDPRHAARRRRRRPPPGRRRAAQDRARSADPDRGTACRRPARRHADDDHCLLRGSGGPQHRRRRRPRRGRRAEPAGGRVPQRPRARRPAARPGSSSPTRPSRRPPTSALDGSVLFRDVASGESLSLLVPGQELRRRRRAALAGGGTVLDPVELSLKAGTLTRVFAVGDPSDGTADAVVQVLTVHVVGSGARGASPPATAGRRPDEVVGAGAVPRLVAVAAGLARCSSPPPAGCASASLLQARPRGRRREPGPGAGAAGSCGVRSASTVRGSPLAGRARRRRLRRAGPAAARQRRRRSGPPRRPPVDPRPSSPRSRRRGGAPGAGQRRAPARAVGRELPAPAVFAPTRRRAARRHRRAGRARSGLHPDGALVIPDDVRTVGWWTGGSRGRRGVRQRGRRRPRRLRRPGHRRLRRSSSG